MSVHVLADTSAKLDGIRAALERKYKVTSQLLTGASVRHGDCDALVVKADLRVVENIAALRKTLGSLAHVPKRIFLLDQTVHLVLPRPTRSARRSSWRARSTRRG